MTKRNASEAPYRQRLEAVLRNYAQCRKKDLSYNLVTAADAAREVQKYGYGLVQGAWLVQGNDQPIDHTLIQFVDQLVEEIDPSWRANTKARLEARQASLSVVSNKHTAPIIRSAQRVTR